MDHGAGAAVAAARARALWHSMGIGAQEEAGGDVGAEEMRVRSKHAWVIWGSPVE